MPGFKDCLLSYQGWLVSCFFGKKRGGMSWISFVEATIDGCHQQVGSEEYGQHIQLLQYYSTTVQLLQGNCYDSLYQSELITALHDGRGCSGQQSSKRSPTVWESWQCGSQCLKHAGNTLLLMLLLMLLQAPTCYYMLLLLFLMLLRLLLLAQIPLAPAFIPAPFPPTLETS